MPHEDSLESPGVQQQMRALSGVRPRFTRMRKLRFITVFLACTLYALAQSDEQSFRKQREEMVRTQLATWDWGAEAVQNPLVLEAFRKVPRHRFVADALRIHAYEDRPLPIGYGQTISQPYIVAKMTELLKPKKGQRALEIGTGSGYQAAILSQLVADVYTMEIVRQLGTSARERLATLGHKNVEVRIADGYYGWPEKAPFDCIVVTAASNHVPPPLIEQLRPGGRLVLPIGNPFQTQRLVLVTKGSKGPRDIKIQDIMAVRFVPLVSGASSQ